MTISIHSQSYARSQPRTLGVPPYQLPRVARNLWTNFSSRLSALKRPRFPRQQERPRHLNLAVFLDLSNFIKTLSYEFRPHSVRWGQIRPAILDEVTERDIFGAPIGACELHVYGSYRPSKRGERQRNDIRTNFEESQSTFLTLSEQQHLQQPPSCPHCGTVTDTCHHCGGDMRRHQEKCVDTQIATDMVRFAWEGRYDVAALISEDRDFIPAIRCLRDKGVGIIHIAVGGRGGYLTDEADGSLDIRSFSDRFIRH